MLKLQRYPGNPILAPQKDSRFEEEAAFNPCVIQDDQTTHILYRAQSGKQPYYNQEMSLSTIGHGTMQDEVHVENRSLLIKPEYDWELFGCEDPRVTKINDNYFIFYTALAHYPPIPEGITVGLAITKDFKKIDQKYHVTPFNAKAMCLFPRKIHDKYVAVLSYHTDTPPSSIVFAYFEKEEQIWSKDYWTEWLKHPTAYSLSLKRSPEDHVEFGAPPIETPYGWLLLYSYIKNYYSQHGKVFGIEAVLLDANDPTKILGHTNSPLLTPEEKYEKEGMIPDIVFPTGAILKGDNLYIYYGGADTTSCLATCKLEELIKAVRIKKPVVTKKLERFEENPIITPNSNNWENKSTCNVASLYWNGKVHLLYRAIANDDTSTIGYALSSDGLHIEERLNKPIYTPREEFESKKKPGNSGCEDPRLTVLGDKIYMCYTAYDGINHPRVALTSINVDDFLNRNFYWSKPKLISSPNMPNKDACIFPERINGKYAVIHRIEPSIWIDFVDDLNFENSFIKGEVLASPTANGWDSNKIGIAGTPIATPDGWLMIYHGISRHDHHYRLGAMLLEYENPRYIIARTEEPILEPQTQYEKEGLVPNVVFSCGQVVIGDNLYVYYGGGDRVIGVASMSLPSLLSDLMRVIQ